MLQRTVFAVTLVAAFVACESAPPAGSQLTVTGGGAGGTDTRFHAPPNGVKIDEASACSALHDALQTNSLAAGCTTTLRPCPDLLRSEFAASCLQYDEGSVQACEDFYAASTDCDSFGSPLACVVVAYTGTAPAGCP